MYFKMNDSELFISGKFALSIAVAIATLAKALS